MARALLRAASALVPTLFLGECVMCRDESRHGRHECPRHITSLGCEESASRARLQKRPLLELFECRAQLFLRVHHDRAVPGHGLFERLARN